MGFMMSINKSSRFLETLDEVLSSGIAENLAPAMAPTIAPKPKTNPGTAPKTAPAKPSPFAPPRPSKLPGPKAETPRGAPATAPSRPKTAPATVPAPAKPSPFAPPRPSILPKPKAVESRANGHSFTEAFDRSVNPYVQNFFDPKKRTDHPLHQHPIFGLYGSELAGRQYAGSKEGYRRHFNTTNPGQIGMNTHAAFMLCRNVESKHVAELERLAVELVSKATGVPIETFVPYLGQHSPPQETEDDEDYAGDDESFGGDEEESTHLPTSGQTQRSQPLSGESLKGEINKRITMNALTQGHALHAMDSMHHLINNELSAIDPRLLKAYSQFSTGSRSQFYFTPLISSLQNAAVREMGRAGFCQLTRDADGQLKVIAYGAVFPVLVQELVKGAMELISMHQFGKISAQDATKIYDVADRAEDEAWHFLVGPQLWKLFLKVVPDHSRIPELVMQLARSKPEVVHRLLSNLIEEIHADRSVDHIKEELKELLHELDNMGADVEASDFVNIDDEFEDDEYGVDEDDFTPYEDR